MTTQPMEARRDEMRQQLGAERDSGARPAGGMRPDNLAEGRTQLVPDPAIWAKLTDREREVAIVLTRRHTYKAVAVELGCAPGTIRVHLHSLRKQVGAKCALDLVMKLCRLDPINETPTTLLLSRETSEPAA